MLTHSHSDGEFPLYTQGKEQKKKNEIMQKLYIQMFIYFNKVYVDSLSKCFFVYKNKEVGALH